MKKIFFAFSDLIDNIIYKSVESNTVYTWFIVTEFVVTLFLVLYILKF